MDSRCRFLTIIKNENGKESWFCYNQYEKRKLIQSCFLKTGPCRYSNGPFPPEPEEAGRDMPESEKRD
ncbi:MAG: hypothetical protein HS130_02065 [Deltaproteobacteria bacterium]|nr:hypothetical protein [Deltaproteobacteria bacterium]MCL4874126.1 hypothetical protein [bacterium]